MKTTQFTVLTALIILDTLGIVAGVSAQTAANQPVLPAPTPWAVVSLDANSQIWERTAYEPGPNGTVVPRKHHFTELASGLNFRDQITGQWVESREEIDAYSLGAIAQHGQYQVIFANDMNSAGAIDLQTPDGKRLRSHILGLAYDDSSTGKSVLIARIQDSQGELISSNQVLYPNAFKGVKADVRYTYKKGSFEQDVILREQPPTPESLGLISKSTEIEVLTEFIDPPQASIVAHPVKANSLPDQDIGWGVMQIGHGRAFDLGESQNNHSQVTVRREYVTAQGRNILVEGVPIQTIKAKLSNLPLQASIASKPLLLASKKLALPKAPSARAERKPIRVASASPSDKGFVLDYVELNTDTNDFTFQPNTTYFISGAVNIGGTTTIGASAVIKLPDDGSGSLNFGSVVCNTTAFGPASFTSENDNSVGETLPWSSGTPSYASCNGTLSFSSSVELAHCRFGYFGTAMKTWGSAVLNDVQFFQCGWSDVAVGAVTVSNALVSGCFVLVDGGVQCENVTFDNCAGAADESSTFTNCIFSSMASIVTNVYGHDITVAGSNNGFGNCDSSLYFGANQYTDNGPFQSGPLGGYYLSPSSAFVDAGNATADTLGLYHFTTQTNQAIEGTSSVDLGYHYVALDSNDNPLDSNNDGIADYLEDANGNGVVDVGETNWGLSILVQPAGLLANAGTSPTLSVTAGGVAPLNYQWYSNSVVLDSATSSTLTFNNVQTNCAAAYYVIVTNNYGSLTSSMATLSVVVPPTVVITNPANNTVFSISPTNITIQATASDTAGNVSVQFFQGTTSLGTVSSAPYALVWSNATTGNYALTAVAVDNGLSATSPVVNVTISPLFVTNTMRLWLKADALAGLTNNAPITNWPDGSGWGDNATQTISASQPALVTNVINWLSVVHFNGTNSFLNLANVLSGTTQAEECVVVRATTNLPSVNRTLWVMGSSSDAGAHFGYPNTSGQIVDGFGSSATYYTVGTPNQPIDQFNVYEVAGQSGDWTAWLNGVMLADFPGNTYAYNNAPNVLGRNPVWGQNWAGDIAEILVFSKALTTAERQTVNAYLNGKYALVPAVPATPSNLLATAVSTSQISLTWNETLNGVATQISIERSTNSTSGFAEVARVVNALSYLDTNLTANTTYYYQVRAINVNTWTPYSNETNAKTFAAGADIPLNSLKLWLKADSVLPQIGTNTTVIKWLDQSGNGNDAAQPTAANQPVWISGALNGLPVINFNPTNHQYFSLPNFMSGATSGGEVFVVARAQSETPTQSHALWHFGGAQYCCMGYPQGNSGGQIVDDFGRSDIQIVGIPAQPLTQYHVFEAASQPTSWKAWINGVLQSQTTVNSVSWSTSPLLGAAYGLNSYFSGDIAEVLIFNRTLTVTERQTINTYLNGKYALVPPVPATPSNLLAIAVSTSQISLTWNETLNSGVTQIGIERSTNSSSGFSEVARVVNALAYLDTNLTANTTYYYQAHAINVNVWSPYSNETNATTLAAGADIPLGNVALWLKADSGLAQIYTNTTVGFWADQSGNGNNASQLTAANQPVWISGALNGLPVIHFNPTNHQYLNLPNILSGTTNGGEAFVVVRAQNETPTQSHAVWSFGASQYCCNGYPQGNSGGQIVDDFGTASIKTVGIPTQPLTQFHIYEALSAANNWSAWINGLLQYQTFNNSASWSTSPYLGAGYALNSYFDGDIAEVLVFNRALSGDEKVTVGSYLLAKYGLSQYATNSSLPGTPTNLIATGVAPYQLNVRWARASTNETGVSIYRKSGTSGVYQDVGSVATGVTNFLDTIISPTNQYFYRVKAENYFGQSGYSTEISPPAIGITNCAPVVLENETNLIIAQAADADSTVSNVTFFAQFAVNNPPIGTAASAPYTVNWMPAMTGPYTVTALATDNQGNSQYSAPVAVTVYLDANGDEIPDIWEVQNGNDPLNPWIPPAANTNDHTAPIITLLIPTNAIVVP